MTALLLVSIFSFNLIEVGLGIGTKTPIGNMERHFSAGALGSVYLAKDWGNSKFTLSYERSNLGGVNQPNYDLSLSQVSFEYSYKILQRNNVALPLSIGIGNIWLKRKLLNLEEVGKSQTLDIGFGFLERINRTSFGAKFFVACLYGLAEPRNASYLLWIKVTFGYEL